MKQEITCICCPMGCAITAEKDDAANVRVSGFGCKRGEKYALQECISPVRVVTASIVVCGGKSVRASVKTATPIPKALIMPVMDEIHSLRVPAPLHIGDVLIHDIAHSGANLVATRNVEAS